MPKRKWYVVWAGKNPGVYDHWDDCSKQVTGVEGARFKSYETEVEAKKAFYEGAPARQLSASSPTQKPGLKKIIGKGPIPDSISVDAAWNSVGKDMEYRGVRTATGEQIFRQGPFKNGTNNVGEFLAIVHGLAWLKQQGLDLPLYSDSLSAIAWVRNKKHKSTLEPVAANRVLFELMERAIKWLENNPKHAQVLKWETDRWGENPADFGRK